MIHRSRTSPGSELSEIGSSRDPKANHASTKVIHGLNLQHGPLISLSEIQSTLNLDLLPDAIAALNGLLRAVLSKCLQSLCRGLDVREVQENGFLSIGSTELAQQFGALVDSPLREQLFLFVSHREIPSGGPNFKTLVRAGGCIAAVAEMAGFSSVAPASLLQCETYEYIQFALGAILVHWLRRASQKHSGRALGLDELARALANDNSLRRVMERVHDPIRNPRRDSMLPATLPPEIPPQVHPVNPPRTDSSRGIGRLNLPVPLEMIPEKKSECYSELDEEPHHPSVAQGTAHVFRPICIAPDSSLYSDFSKHCSEESMSAQSLSNTYGRTQSTGSSRTTSPVSSHQEPGSPVAPSDSMPRLPFDQLLSSEDTLKISFTSDGKRSVESNHSLIRSARRMSTVSSSTGGGDSAEWEDVDAESNENGDFNRRPATRTKTLAQELAEFLATTSPPASPSIQSPQVLKKKPKNGFMKLLQGKVSSKERRVPPSIRTKSPETTSAISPRYSKYAFLSIPSHADPYQPKLNNSAPSSPVTIDPPPLRRVSTAAPLPSTATSGTMDLRAPISGSEEVHPQSPHSPLSHTPPLAQSDRSPGESSQHSIDPPLRCASIPQNGSPIERSPRFELASPVGAPPSPLNRLPSPMGTQRSQSFLAVMSRTELESHVLDLRTSLESAEQRLRALTSKAATSLKAAENMIRARDEEIARLSVLESTYEEDLDRLKQVERELLLREEEIDQFKIKEMRMESMEIEWKQLKHQEQIFFNHNEELQRLRMIETLYLARDRDMEQSQNLKWELQSKDAEIQELKTLNQGLNSKLASMIDILTQAMPSLVKSSPSQSESAAAAAEEFSP
jgi:hypothetical protein